MYDTDHLLQSKIWKKSKELMGYTLFEVNGVWGQISTTPLFSKKVGYVARAMVDGALIESLKQEGKKKDLVFITVDPVNSSDKMIQESVFIRKTKPIQLRRTLILSLQKNEDVLFNEIKKKDRYTIRKALEQNIETTFGTDFNTFALLYKSTMSGHAVVGRNESYLKNVFNVALEWSAVQIAVTKVNDEITVASMILIHDNVAYYLYAGSNDKAKKTNASYVHVWNCIKHFKEEGLLYFDLFGLDEDLESGFSRFKRKFGGEIIEYADSFDIIINPFWYSILQMGKKIFKS